jgi:hypothetical protein
MPADPEPTPTARDEGARERRLRRRYAVLTAALSLPLLWAFLAVRNLYPFAASTMMMEGWGLGRPRTYYVLRGETAGGETVELPPARLTDALSGRHWALVAAAVDNKSLSIRWPHPSNQALLGEAGGPERLPEAARLPELLRAWGSMHNARLPADSPRRLRAVRLDAYRWEGQRFGDYDTHVRTWRQEL